MVAKWIGRAGTPMEKGLAAGRGISRIRAAAVGGSCHLSPSASRCGRDHSSDTDQVVCGSYEVAGELRPLQPDEARPSESPDRFHPAEDLFNGLFTNDKFCWSRQASLRLKWWRRAYRDR